jgi:hypothetical protein
MATTVSRFDQPELVLKHLADGVFDLRGQRSGNLGACLLEITGSTPEIDEDRSGCAGIVDEFLTAGSAGVEVRCRSFAELRRGGFVHCVVTGPGRAMKSGSRSAEFVRSFPEHPHASEAPGQLRQVLSRKQRLIGSAANDFGDLRSDGLLQFVAAVATTRAEL